MKGLRDDAWPGCAARRARASSTPAPVTVPLATSSAVLVIAIALALLVGLPAAVVTAIAVAVAVAAAGTAHRTFGSLVAGAGMRLARPYAPGEQVRLYAPALCSVVDAEVVRAGPANTTLMTSGGLVLVANKLMLRDAPEQADSSDG